MGLRKRVFSKEFKVQVVRAVQSGKRPGQLAREYQLQPALISRWISEYETYAEEAFAGKGHRYTKEARAAALARENDRLQRENELLKKALRCLTEQPASEPESRDSA